MASVHSKQWDAVVAKRLKECNFPKEQLEYLKNASVDSAQTELAKVQKEHAKDDKASKVLEKAKPWINTFNTFADFAGQLASLDAHGIASLVVGSLSLVFKLASAYMEAFQKISAFFDTIGARLAILIDQDNRYRENAPDRLKDVLFRVFNAYWTFFADVHSLLWSKDRGKAKGFWSHVGDFITGKIATIENDVQSFEDCCDEANKEISFANDVRSDEQHGQLLGVVQAVEVMVLEGKREWFRERRRLFMQWLRPSESDHKLVDQLSTRTPGTGTWIFRDSHYSRWLHGDGDGAAAQVLRLVAGPGVGKSSLSAFLTNDLRRTVLTGVAYFAFDSGSEFNTIPNMLRTILYQLLREETDTNEPHVAVEQSMFRHSFDDGGSADNMASLLDILNEINSNRRNKKKTIVVIDALDECLETKDNTRNLRSFFRSIAQFPENWKFLITSRISPWSREIMEKELESSPFLSRELNRDDINSDISAYIAAELDARSERGKLKWNDDEFRAWFQDELCRRSEGMFKWTALVLQDRKGLASEKAMRLTSYAREALEHAPEGVVDIYKGVLDRLSVIEDSMVKDDMIRALRWILRSYRPLRIADLEIALANVDDLGTRDNLLDQLEDHLGDLLYINAKTGTLQLTHTSAREFLTKKPPYQCPSGEQLIPGNLAEVDVELLRTCLKYLTNDDRDFFDCPPPSRETDRNFARKLDDTGFLEYAAVGWIHHLSSVCRAGLVTEDMKEDLDILLAEEDHLSLLQWMQVFSFARFTNRYGAAEAYSVMLEALSEKPTAGNEALARLLREDFTDFYNHFGWVDGGRFVRWQKFLSSPAAPCFNPTLLASFFDYNDALETMIEDGETVHYGRGIKPSAVFWAAAGDSASTLRLLLSANHVHEFPARKGALRGRNGQSILKEATFVPRDMLSRPGNFSTAQMLVDDGCFVSYDFEVQLLENVADSPEAAELVRQIRRKIPLSFTFNDDSVGSALNYAVFTGQSHIVKALAEDQQFLLKTKKTLGGTAVSERPPEQWLAQVATWLHRESSAIHHAAANNDSRSLRLLCVETGYTRLSSEKEPRNGWTPLHLAAQRGCERLKRRKGVDNEILKDKIPIEPSEHAVHTLCEVGHRLDREDRAYNLPIHLAAYIGCEETLSRLSQPNYEWDKPNRDGKTPLAIALEMRHTKAVQLLLRKGAHIDRVPQHLHNYIPSGSDKQNDHTESSCCTDSAWIHCVLTFRKAARKWIPIPIIARIVKFKELFEHSVERHDDYEYDELVMEPYLQSPPIRPINSAVRVKRVAITVRSSRFPGTGRHTWEPTWSWIRMDKLDANSGALVPWHERSILRHNYCETTTETIIFDDRNEKDAGYLKGLNFGDRIVISPVAIYPAWTAQIEWASITIETTSVLREALSNQDRKKIWSVAEKSQEQFRKYQEGENMVQCLPGRRQDDGTARKPSRRRRPK